MKFFFKYKFLLIYYLFFLDKKLFKNFIKVIYIHLLKNKIT